MLRNFFEGLGDLFQATFKILPIAGDIVNSIFMLIIAGGLLYWVIQMRRHKANGERNPKMIYKKAPKFGAFLFVLRDLNAA